MSDIDFKFKISQKEKKYHCRPLSKDDLNPILNELERGYSMNMDHESKKNDDFDWNEYLSNAYTCFNASYDSQILSIDGIRNGTMWLKTIANNINKLSTENRNRCYNDIKKFISKYGIK